MKMQPRVVLLLAAFLSFRCATSTPKTDETPTKLVELKQGAAFYAGAFTTEPPAQPLLRELALAVMELAKDVQDSALKWDSRLARATGDLARFVPSEQTIGYGTIEFVLHHYGIIEPTPRLLVAFGDDREARDWIEQLKPRIHAMLESGAHARFGIGIARRGRQTAFVLALLPSFVELSPIARRAKLTQPIIVEGRVLPPYARPAVWVTPAGGEAYKPDIETDRDGMFVTTVSCRNARGIIRIEVTAESDAGPAVMANFPVYCGMAPSTATVVDVADKEQHSVAGAERRLLALINREREQRGLFALEIDSELAAVARKYSQEMKRTGRIEHVSPQSGEVKDRLRAAGIQRAVVRENLARAGDIVEAHRSLMNSPGHRANILARDASHVGVGVAMTDGSDGQAVIVTELFAYRGEIDEDWIEVFASEISKAHPKLRRDERLMRAAKEHATNIANRGEGMSGARKVEIQVSDSKLRSVAAMLLLVEHPDQIDPSTLELGSGTQFGVGAASGPHPEHGTAIYVVVLIGERST